MSGQTTSRRFQAWLGIWLLLIAVFYGPLSGMPPAGAADAAFSLCGPSSGPQTPLHAHDDSNCPLCCFQHHTGTPLPLIATALPNPDVTALDMPLWQQQTAVSSRIERPNQPRAPPAFA